MSASLLSAPGAARIHTNRGFGGALFAKGFRPFFLVAALFAFSILPTWVAVFLGLLRVDSYFDPITWHAHEMIFGFAVAVLAGFLLTAVGNWTKRETLVGAPLAALCALWICGRLAVTFASHFPRGVPALVDGAFLPALMIPIARSLVFAKNKRNFVMLAILGALALSNVAIHLDALGILPGVGRHAYLFAVDVVIFVILVMAGRVFPMFTRNGTGIDSIQSSTLLDRLAIGTMALLLMFDLAAPDSLETTLVSLGVAALALVRSRKWGALHTRAHPLLWILHAGYLWIVVGLALRIAPLFDASILPSLSTHALTAGAIGSLTLGMMARVSLGHTGRLMQAPKGMAFAIALVTLAAAVRVFVPMLHPAWYRAALESAGVAWAAAFAIFLSVYAPILMTKRADGQPE